ncbi:MAG TPA: AcvB/VirJ family lysyl-phosphatidylglycerol hydrolase, partial [Balneolales bacterium]|nr:AcvB/VirJ family lysyl-phosphatidylglycerol hydrolase [Balneolales bacterium]
MKYLKLLPIFALLLCTRFASAKAVQVDSLHFGTFGKVHIYQTSENPDQVVLFVSGDGGWNEGVVDMAEELAKQNAMVIGIDINTMFHNMLKIKRKCLYPAGDFQELAQYVQRKKGLPEYHIPILAGYSSGATMVYVLLAEAPINTFAGGISLGFGPDLDFPKPFCRGALLQSKLKKSKKGYLFLPVSHLDLPWIVLQGNIDRVTDPTIS